jgi:hypothetical protein
LSGRLQTIVTAAPERAYFLTGIAAESYYFRINSSQYLMKLFIPIIIFVFALPAAAQVSLRNGPAVNGVSLGATYKAMIAKFGKPLREKTNKMDECIGDRTRTVNYPGLSFDLAESEGTFTVYGFEVTSPKYDVSGVKVGSAAASVQKRFGTHKRTVETVKSGPHWFYDMTEESPGGTSFYFRNGKVLSISSNYAMC